MTKSPNKRHISRGGTNGVTTEASQRPTCPTCKRRSAQPAASAAAATTSAWKGKQQHIQRTVESSMNGLTHSLKPAYRSGIRETTNKRINTDKQTNQQAPVMTQQGTVMTQQGTVMTQQGTQ